MSDAAVIVVGGGPAGMMAGFLLARAGVAVTVLEKHADFFRDFRGDTVHPSTMEILQQLGLLERFLARPHNRIDRAKIRIDGRDWTIGDVSHLRTAAPFIAMMPQWEFLDFLRVEAAALPAFHLEMTHHATGLIEQHGRVVGVTLAGGGERRAAKLVIAADGRSSLVRSSGMLAVEELGAPMDVLWFELPKTDAVVGQEGGGDALRGSIAAGRMVVLIDRDSYWQVAFLVPKGHADDVLGRGVEWLRGEVQAAFPDLDLAVGAIASRETVRLLSVALDRLTEWSRPGLLAIGDAAHAMSPIGGIGINLAIQDAVAAANLLAGPLARGEGVDRLLAGVQRRRALPTRIIQAGQKAVQDGLIDRVLGGGPVKVPLVVRLLDAFPLLRRIPGRIIGLGIRRETIAPLPLAGEGDSGEVRAG